MFKLLLYMKLYANAEINGPVTRNSVKPRLVDYVELPYTSQQKSMHNCFFFIFTYMIPDIFRLKRL